MRRYLIATWGVLGVVLLLAQALWRLTPLALEAISDGLSPAQWVLLVAWVVINAHAEGYRGFHRRFSPRVVARALVLAHHPRPLYVLLAPLYCMSLMHASKRGMAVAYGILVGVVLLIIAIRLLDQPWRGIVDAGVVVGLAIGLVSILWYAVRAGLGHALPIDPDLPSDSDFIRA